MENFFIEDKFYQSIEDYLCEIEIDEDPQDFVGNLDDGYTLKVEMCDLEPIFNIDAESLCQILADANEERLSEDYDEEAKVLKALNECIDFEKLKILLPNFYYPNGKFATITKQDLINHL